MSATRRRPGPTVVGVCLATLEPTAVGVSRLGERCPTRWGCVTRDKGPTAVGVSRDGVEAHYGGS
jgi:hypothetical protein